MGNRRDPTVMPKNKLQGYKHKQVPNNKSPAPSPWWTPKVK